MDGNKQLLLYLMMAIGTLGLILIVVGILMFFEVSNDIGYTVPMIGFTLTMAYIHFLEEKAGISNRIIWVKSFLSIALLVVVAYLLFL